MKKIFSIVIILLALGIVVSFTANGKFLGQRGIPSGATAFGDDTLTIKAMAGANGSISPLGDVKVARGQSQSFAIVPNEGYLIKDVLVDSFSVGMVKSYDFVNVASNHTISATFVENSLTITASADSNGTISPSGRIPVSEGAMQSFSIVPNPGYRIANVKVDDKPVGEVNAYTFNKISWSHTITASFAPDTSK
jgi:hypothetical protein